MTNANTVTSSALIARWRKRRREILRTLAPDLLAEYRELGKCIRLVRTEEACAAQEEAEEEKPVPSTKAGGATATEASANPEDVEALKRIFEADCVRTRCRKCGGP